MTCKKVLVIAMSIFAIGALFPAASSAAVTYFAECAWTDTNLVCFVYADTGTDSLISGAVALSYNPSELNDPDPADAAKNEEEWFFGKVTDKQSYMNPEIDLINKKVIFVVGKLELDASDQPTGEGASGPRLKIGEVEFSRKTTDDPLPDPNTFFGLELSLGRGGDYVNFVNTNGDPLDSSATNGSTTTALRGDADANGFFTPRDFTALRSYLNNDTYVVYADCDGNGFMTPRDFTCLRSKL